MKKLSMYNSCEKITGGSRVELILLDAFNLVYNYYNNNNGEKEDHSQVRSRQKDDLHSGSTNVLLSSLSKENKVKEEEHEKKRKELMLKQTPEGVEIKEMYSFRYAVLNNHRVYSSLITMLWVLHTGFCWTQTS